MTYLLPTIVTEEQWSAIFLDVALWRPVVLEICSREGIAYSHIESGHHGTNAVFLLDRKYVIKIYGPVWNEFGVERELHIALGRKAEVPVPKIVSSGQFVDRIEWDYLITEYVEGRPIGELRDSLDWKDLIDIAARLGEIVRTLHQTDLTSLESLRGHHETRLRLTQRRTAEVVRGFREKGILSDAVLDDLGPFLEAASMEIGDRQAVLVHGDLTEDHLLLKRHAGRWAITGLLDFGDAQARPTGYEWPALWLDLLRQDTEALRAFFDSYDRTVLEDEDFTRRAFVWTLIHEWGPEMVEDVLMRRDGPPIRSVDDLRHALWPDDLRTV